MSGEGTEYSFPAREGNIFKEVESGKAVIPQEI
jgi:hypothetical protein